jgi:hypothetical protein
MVEFGERSRDIAVKLKYYILKQIAWTEETKF